MDTAAGTETRATFAQMARKSNQVANWLRSLGVKRGDRILLPLGNVMPIEGVAPVDRPAVHGRLAPLGHGKDTTAGHWELMGVTAPRLPVYPNGFPTEIVEAFERGSFASRACYGPGPSLRRVGA